MVLQNEQNRLGTILTAIQLLAQSARDTINQYREDDVFDEEDVQNLRDLYNDDNVRGLYNEAMTANSQVPEDEEEETGTDDENEDTYVLEYKEDDADDDVTENKEFDTLQEAIEFVVEEGIATTHYRITLVSADGTEKVLGGKGNF